MHKRLWLILAVLITPVFLVSCSSHEEVKTVDPEVLESTVARAMEMADSLDNMNLKAFQMGQVGSSMAKVDPAGASQVLEDAYTLASQTHSMTYKAALRDLENKTADWPAAEMEQVAGSLDRIQKATTRAWVIRTIAEGMARVNTARAMSVLSGAGAEAERIPDARYRDLDLRGVAAAMAPMDVQAAYGMASRIADPRVKAYALMGIGKTAAASDREEAARILGAAGEVALSIQRMEPVSELISEETHAKTKEEVLEFEKSKLTAASARSLSSIALASSPVEPVMASQMYRKAAESAMSIPHPYTKAYAISDVAMNLAEVNPQGAEELAARIEGDHADARFAVLMKAAKVRAQKSGSGAMPALKNVENAARAIEDEFDRAKAMAEVAMTVLEFNKEKAADIAGEIEYKKIKDEVLSAVAVAWAREDITTAKEALEKIEEPRFAKKSVLHVKAKALSEMAGILAAKDAEAAMKLYGKATGAATDSGSTAALWDIATGMCMLDPDRLFTMAAKIEEGDYENQAMALSEIAAGWSQAGDFKAPMVWDMAAKAANSVSDDVASVELLVKVASRCAGYDTARAASIYKMALARADHIGVVEG